MQRFTDLKVWQRSHELVLQVYRITREFPEDERFGLVSQMRRAAASAPANIAEGSKRKGPQDFARFLNQAESSLAETEYFMILSRDLGYVRSEIAATHIAEIQEIGRMLYALRTKVEEGGST